MKKLDPWPGEPWDVFVSIRDAKYETRSATRQHLHGLTELLKERYRDYREHRTHLETIPERTRALERAERIALQHCYKSETRPLRRLKRDIRARQSEHARAKCQYCGISRPDTFDHYLPLELFPEFAVYPGNLVPSCGACNRDRGTRWLVDDGRCLVHLYFDEVEEEERFLFAELVFDDHGSPTGACFRVDSNAGENAIFGALYERHITSLKLCDKFTEQSAARLQRNVREIRRLLGLLPLDEAGLTSYLHQRAQEHHAMLGANNWEVALFYAEAESSAYRAYCLRGGVE